MARRQSSATRLYLSTCTLDLTTRRILEGEEVTGRLTTLEAQLLSYLAERSQEVVPREQLLTDVWGYDADTNTRAVYTAIERLRRKIEADPRKPRHLVTVHGRGVQLDLSAASPLADAPRRSNLPASVDSFVGRGEELEQLRAMVESGGHLVTLLGPGGVGKTSLAQQLGLVLEEDTVRAAAGVWYCELADCTNALDLTQAVAATISQGGGTIPYERSEDLGRVLRGLGPAVLILDNFEQIADQAEVVAGWMSAAPNIIFIITSRQRLALSQEQVLVVGPLDPEAATQLYRQRSQSLSAAPTEGDDHILAELVELLDGIPLAIELVAARAHVLSPHQMVERIKRDSLLSLAGKRRGTERHMDLRHAIAWSWQLLEPAEQNAVVECLAFRGGFTVGAAEAVLSGEALSMLDVLEAKSLVRVQRRPQRQQRLSLYVSIRAFAEEHRDEDAWTRVRRAHADHYLGVSEELGRLFDTTEQFRAHRELLDEQQNLLAIYRRHRTLAPDIAARAIHNLYPVLSTQGPFDAHVELLDDVIALSRDEGLRAWLHYMRGHIQYKRGQRDRARVDIELAVSAGRSLPDDALLSRALRTLGLIELEVRPKDEVLAVMREAVEVSDRLGDPFGGGQGRAFLARAYMRAGETDTAEALMREALEQLRAIGSPRTLSTALNQLGMLMMERGRLHEAVEYLREGDLVAEPLKDITNEHLARLSLGSALLGLGHHDEAQSLYQAALDYYALAGNDNYATQAELNLGTVCVERGNIERAFEHYELALARSSRLDRPQPRILALLNMAVAEVVRGRPLVARQRVREAQKADPDLNYKRAALFLDCLDAIAAAEAGDLEGASTSLDAAKSAVEEMVAVPTRFMVRLSEAVVRRAQGDAAAVPAVLDAMEEPVEEGGLPIRQVDQELRVLSGWLRGGGDPPV